MSMAKETVCDALHCVLCQLCAHSRSLTQSLSVRFSLSMNLLTPLFGMRALAFHTALKDCEAESVVITAFVRFIASRKAPPTTPATKKGKKRKSDVLV